MIAVSKPNNKPPNAATPQVSKINNLLGLFASSIFLRVIIFAVEVFKMVGFGD